MKYMWFYLGMLFHIEMINLLNINIKGVFSGTVYALLDGGILCNFFIVYITLI